MPRYFPAVGDRKDKLEMILVDAICCPVDNLDTINLMVIMGDLSGHDEFVVTAFALSCKGGEYNVLIAQPDEFKEQLRSSAKKKWLCKLSLQTHSSNGHLQLSLTTQIQRKLQRQFS
ncbi:BnaC04g21750D [Brassica napus]|uniref:BnaC04g21750D protein n=1 Tax=Brassica napus TaxID=3708 RepID=A0A078HZ94_BRANA|nr:BnaC04g21750D [Brassica napus]